MVFVVFHFLYEQPQQQQLGKTAAAIAAAEAARFDLFVYRTESTHTRRTQCSTAKEAAF